MAITASQIYTLAAKLAQDEGFNTNAESSDYLEACNEAHRRLAEILKNGTKVDSATSTVDGTQYYALPSDYMAMYEKNSNAYGPVRVYKASTGQYFYPTFMSFQQIESMLLTDLYTAEGDPKYCWTDVKDQLWIYPTPDFTGTSNVQISYYNYPANLSSGLGTSDYPNKFLFVLAYLTAGVIAEYNELDGDILKFQRLALTRLNSVATAGDLLDTNKNRQRIGYIG